MDKTFKKERTLAGHHHQRSPKYPGSIMTGSERLDMGIVLKPLKQILCATGETPKPPIYQLKRFR